MHDDQEEIAGQKRQATEKSDLTRREWLLRFGGSAVLAGVRGVPSQGAAGVQDAAGSNTLPPGLYEPSEDHMTHALTSDERFRAIPAGSETDFVQPVIGAFKPRFFTPAEYQTVRRLVALVLGETESTSDAESLISEISEWVDLEAASSEPIRQAARQVPAQTRTLIAAFHGEDRIAAIEAHDAAKIWREGLAWLSEESQHRWGTEFLAASATSQNELLQSISSSSSRSENAGTRLFELLKHEVIRGFYTSRAGLKELDFKGNAFLAECPGCSTKAAD